MNDFGHGPDTIKIGDLEVRRNGFGAMQLPGPGVWGEPKDPERARAVLRRVVELGINFIDTSWYYGPFVSNRLIKETLHPYPSGLVIATKLGGRRTPDKGWATALRPEELRKGCDEDLRLLGLDRIDVVHLRWIAQADVTFAESLDAMIEMQKEGKIRHIGLSNITVPQFEEALARTSIVTVENLYNVVAGEARLAKLPHMLVERQEEIVDLCTARGIAFLPFFSLAIPGMKRDGDVLASIATRHQATEAQIAIAWLLARSPMILPISGTSSPAHAEENWNARKIALLPEEVAAITKARAT